MHLRRFGILGDIHAEDELLAIALDRLSREEVDDVLAVGDVVDGPGSADACCRLLAERDVLTVRGNHERWLLEGTMRDLPHAVLARDLDPATRRFLASLPPTRRLSTVRGDLLLCHATGEDDMRAVREEDSAYALASNDALQAVLRDGDVAWLVCGHTHRRMVRRVGRLTIINAGTLSSLDEPGFGVVDLGEEPEVTFFVWAGGDVVVADVVSVLPAST